MSCCLGSTTTVEHVSIGSISSAPPKVMWLISNTPTGSRCMYVVHTLSWVYTLKLHFYKAACDFIAVLNQIPIKKDHNCYSCVDFPEMESSRVTSQKHLSYWEDVLQDLAKEKHHTDYTSRILVCYELFAHSNCVTSWHSQVYLWLSCLVPHGVTLLAIKTFQESRKSNRQLGACFNIDSKH